jgi:hypothetical protein
MIPFTHRHIHTNSHTYLIFHSLVVQQYLLCVLMNMHHPRVVLVTRIRGLHKLSTLQHMNILCIMLPRHGPIITASILILIRGVFCLCMHVCTGSMCACVYMAVLVRQQVQLLQDDLASLKPPLGQAVRLNPVEGVTHQGDEDIQ